MQEEEREELNGIMEMRKKNKEFQLRRGDRRREEDAERRPCTAGISLQIRPCNSEEDALLKTMKNGSAHVMVEDIECSEL